MNIKLLVLITFFFSNFKLCHSTNYQHYALLNMTPVTKDQLNFLQGLSKQSSINMIYWQKPYKVNHDVHMIIDPIYKELFLDMAKQNKLEVSVLLDDIQKEFNKQSHSKFVRAKDTFQFDIYHTLEDINQWLSNLTIHYPETIEMQSIGGSIENKDILAISFRMGSEEKDKVFIEAGIHGNEWITTAFVLYLLNELVSGISQTSGLNSALATDYHWILIPIVNPDGYEYAHSVDRLYCKNKRLMQSAIGVNLDRNFNYKFGQFDASDNPLDDNFCGQEAFSEPESKALADFIAKSMSGIKYYFSFHAYGQMIILPYTNRALVMQDFYEMEAHAKEAAAKVKRVLGAEYIVGNTVDAMGFQISGNSANWVKKNFNLKYVYTIYLSDNGTYGHALPCDQIIPTSKEGILVLSELIQVEPKREPIVMMATLENHGNRLKSQPVLRLFLLYHLLK